MDNVHPLWGTIIFLAIVIIHNVLYGFGAAIQQINESELEEEKDSKRKQDIQKLIDKPYMFTNTLHIVTIILNVILGVVVIASYRSFFKEQLDISSDGLVTLLVALVSITILVVFGVFVPKKMALKNPMRYLYNTVGIVKVIMFSMALVTFVGTVLSKFIVRLLGGDPNADTDVVTEEEIMDMVNEGHEQGVILASEAEMINNIFEFGDKTAVDIMTHRKNIIAIDANMTLESAWKMMVKENLSRFPVYDADLDDIIGILHYRDVAREFENVDKRKLTVLAFKDIMFDASLIPETRNINVLFNEMQTNKMHMAIVVDEYGQTAGLVTMEDILEEIVGNILDEYDEEEESITVKEDDTYVVEGRTLLEELEEFLHIEFYNDEFDTLNGFIISKIGKIPEEGEKISVEYEGYLFEVMKVEGKRIDTVSIKKIKTEENDE